MSSAPPRWIVIDDGNPRIHYQSTNSTSWAVGNSSNSPNTIFGGPFNNTLHQLVGAGNFSFNFTGSSVSVIGSFPNIYTTTPPSWSCFIGGIPLTPSNIPGVNRNNWELCRLQNITTTAPSNLVVTASGSANSPFQLDRIEYIPTASEILDNSTVVVDANDNQIHYDSGWSGFRDIGMQTSVNGSTMTLDFIGVGVTWVSVVPNSSITVNSSAQYRFDGGTFFQFNVTASSSVFDLYNQIAFQVPAPNVPQALIPLNPGSHRLDVQYLGDNNTAPLILDYLIIQNLTHPPFIATPIPHKLKGGAIAGIVIGSLAGLVIIGILAWFVYDRWKQRKLAAQAQLANQREQAKLGHNQDGTDDTI